MEKLTDKLFTVKYNEDTGKPHIEIVNQNVCLSKCTGKYCTHFCPAGVYEWNEEQSAGPAPSAARSTTSRATPPGAATASGTPTARAA